MRQAAFTVLEWLLVTVASMLVMAAVYPDMLVHAQIRFTAGHDGAVPFQAAWLHASYFLHNGVQLWNRFDQVNHAFLHLSLGFQGLAPIVEGWLFSVFGHGLSRPGEAFQAFHPIAFFTLATLFRTAGGLALLRLYPVPFWARLLTLLVANTLLAAQTYDGVVVGFLYSLLPLVLYFVILFFRRFSLAALLWLILALGLAFAQAPLIAVGYFYLPVHFFALSALFAFGWWAIQARRDGNPCPLGEARLRIGRWEIGFLAAGYGALAVILAMNLNDLHLLTRTFYIGTSGLNGTQGRFDNILNPIAYLTSGPPGPKISNLARRVLDFTENDWWMSWLYIGATSLGLSLIGITHGRHRERWIYLATVILIVLAQLPRRIPSFGLPVHLVTALTDPFAFLVVHTHMVALEMPYFLIVPIGLGLTALWRRAQTPTPLSDEKRADGIATAILLAGAVFALVALPLASGLESAAIFVGLTLCLLAPRIGLLQGHARLLTVVIPLAAVAADLWGYSVYLERVPYTGDRIQPRTFKGIEATDGRRINPVVIDYQNPATLTFPRHVRVKPDPTTPNTDLGFPSKHAVYFGPPTYMAAYFQTIFLSREFAPPKLYEIRPLAYANASDKVLGEDRRGPDDKALYPLLRGDNRALFFAPVAVRADKVGPAALLKADAGRWAVSLADPAGDKRSIPGARDTLPGTPPALPAPPPDIRRFRLTLADAVGRRQRDGFVEYDFALPHGFPAYMATNLFTADRDAIRLVLDGKQLSPAQGRLIRPFTFDVRNVATNRLVVALPANQPADTHFEFSVLIDPFLKDVQPNTNDTTGLEVEAPADGWLVWRAPYEDGWQATVNGQPAPIYIADRTAMAVRIPTGKSKVIFAYKPAASDCCTRQLVEAHLLASPMLALIILGAILYGAGATIRTGSGRG